MDISSFPAKIIRGVLKYQNLVFNQMYAPFKVSQMYLRKWWQCRLLCLSMLSLDLWHSVLLIGRPGKTVLLLIWGYLVNTVAMKLIHLNSGRLWMRAKKPITVHFFVYTKNCVKFYSIHVMQGFQSAPNRRPEMVNYWEVCAQWTPRVVFTVAIFLNWNCMKLNNTKQFWPKV